MMANRCWAMQPHRTAKHSWPKYTSDGDRGKARPFISPLPRRERGFTLVELLVVITIIGILIALLLPAVQAAREAARRMQCSNHLKQIGLACLNHEQAYGILPDGGEQYWLSRTKIGGRPATAGEQNWGWLYQILPYLEQENVWSLATDADVFGTRIATYFCPSRRAPEALSNNPLFGASAGSRAQNDYAGNGGTDPTGSMGWAILGNGKDGTIVRRPNGSTQRSGSVPMARIYDGTSNTLLAAEKAFNQGRRGEWQPDDDGGYTEGWDFDTIRWGYFPPLPDWNDASNLTRYGNNGPFVALHGSFGSAHSGAFISVFVDGSVRPIGYSITLDVFKRLSSRNDGQPVSPNDY